MLLNLHKKSWMDGLILNDYVEHCKMNENTVNEMLELAKNYNKVRTCHEIHSNSSFICDHESVILSPYCLSSTDSEDCDLPTIGM